jgi:hypothetical protein
MPCAKTSSPSLARAWSDVGKAGLMTTWKPAWRIVAKSSGWGMPLEASWSSMSRKFRMCWSVFTGEDYLKFGSPPAVVPNFGATSAGGSAPVFNAGLEAGEFVAVDRVGKMKLKGCLSMRSNNAW